MVCFSQLDGCPRPLLGNILVFQLQDLRFSLLGIPMDNLQVLFALSALTRLVPLLILRKINYAKGNTSRSLLSRMLRGNVLSYAYNATIYSLATAESTRARAAAAPCPRVARWSFGYPQRSGRGTWPPRVTYQHRSLGRRP